MREHPELFDQIIQAEEYLDRPSLWRDGPVWISELGKQRIFGILDKKVKGDGNA